jgi:hypothetical protein
MVRFQLKDEEYTITMIQIQYPDPSPYSTISSLFDDLTAIVFTGSPISAPWKPTSDTSSNAFFPAGEVWRVEVDGGREIRRMKV